MNKIKRFFGDKYLLILYITFYVAIVISAYCTGIVRDLIYFNQFEKRTCEELFFGKRNINQKGKDWYCKLDHELYNVHVNGSVLLENEEFENNEVWFNQITKNAYKASINNLYNELVQMLLRNAIVLIVFVILSLFAISNISYVK